MARRRRPLSPRTPTPRSDLDRLPQFEPDHTFNLDATRERVLPFFPETRARHIRDVLSLAIKRHVRKTHFQGESTSLERFLRNAMLAIATYESRSLRRPAHDREKASKLLTEVLSALWAFQRSLERIVGWKQLDRYLETVHVTARKQNERQENEPEGRRRGPKLSVRALLRRRKLADLYRKDFHSRSPKGILNQLRLLEPLLTLALEKLEFQPGDFQRDEIVREFADAMVLAWMSATGAVPTISKSKPLPFQLLMATINREILKPEIRHSTDFRSHAVLAVGRANA